MLEFLITIKKNIVTVLVIIIALLLLGLGLVYKHYVTVKTDRDNQIQNTTILQTKLVTTVDKYGDTIKTIGVLKESLSQALHNNDSLKSMIKGMNIKPKNVTGFGTGNVGVNNSIGVKLKDSSITINILPTNNQDSLTNSLCEEKVSIKTGDYKDEWLKGTFIYYKSQDSIGLKFSLNLPIFYVKHEEF